MSRSHSGEAPHILYITYHLPMDEEPGAFRPWVEARLLRDSGYQVTVITSAVQYMTEKLIGPGSSWCRHEVRDGIRILRVWTISDYRRSFFRRLLNYSIFALLAALAACCNSSFFAPLAVRCEDERESDEFSSHRHCIRRHAGPLRN